MARVTGLEPAASGVTGRRSNQLSYTRAGSGGRIRTYDQRINSPLRYRCATPDQCVGGYIAERAGPAKALRREFLGISAVNGRQKASARLLRAPRRNLFQNVRERMEARAGIEPTYTDLQSAASPLCHRAILTGTGAPFPVRPRCGAVV